MRIVVYFEDRQQYFDCTMEEDSTEAMCPVQRNPISETWLEIFRDAMSEQWNSRILTSIWTTTIVELNCSISLIFVTLVAENS